MSGRRVLVTRAAEDAPVLSHYLGRAGFEPVEVPLLQRLWQVEQVAEVAREGTWDVVLFTSATAVDVYAAASPDFDRLKRIAVVGPGTNRRATEVGLPVHVMPGRATAEALVEKLGDVAGLRILFPRADMASLTTVHALRERGATIVDVVAYTNVAPTDHVRRLREAVPVDATTLMSGSAAARLAQAIPADAHGQLGKIIVIGPTTEKAAVAEGLVVTAVAQPHTVAGMVGAVQRVFRA